MVYNYKVIGIGLSAGGMSPLIEIIKAIPASTKAVLVVVVHIPINAFSYLSQILRQHTKMPVVAVSTIEHMQPGTVYVMEAGKELRLTDGFLQISERNPNQKINNTIDILFTSMAADAKSQSIGIILSGAGYDGLEGAKAIEDEHGLVIVQDPDTAQFPLMAGHLIAHDHPDYVLTPHAIAEKIKQQLH